MSERELFEAALERPTDERGRFLDEACAGDPQRRHQVDLLLARHAEAGSFLEQPAAEQDFTVAHDRVTETAGTIIGPYKLLQKIGEGGFGAVFMAEQQQPVRRIVAVKVIKPGMDTAQVIARFESERQALALMDHPNIAKVLDAGTTASGRPYFVMELVKGVPITEFCDRNHMPAADRLQLFISVCHAIQHAHHKGVVHRDIKPSNVMVTLHDGVPVVKVIDFGVAKATVQKLTERTLFTAYGQMIGTPAYMSPEQAEMSCLDIDTRSDVYSLGVLLYELLTGTTPLESKKLREAGYVEMQRLIREEEPQRPSTRMSSLGESATVLAGNRGVDVKKLTQLLSGDLDWLVMKALEKDRNRRYGTPSNFAEDIERYLRREPILARPPSVLYKFRKFTQRNRPAVLAGTAIAVAILLGLAGLTFGFLRSNELRKEAERAEAQQSRQREIAEAALTKATISEQKAVAAERTAQQQAASSAYGEGQQLCEGNSVAQGLFTLGRALKLAHAAEDKELEEATRWNINAWLNELHPLAYVMDLHSTGPRPQGAFHPDGKTLAVGVQNSKKTAIVVRLYNAETGASLDQELEVPGANSLNALVWTPAGDRLGIYAGDGKIYLWRPTTDAPEVTIKVADPYNEYDVRFAFSPDGSKLIAGSQNPFAQIFDTQTGEPTGMKLEYTTNLHPTSHATPGADWSRDGKLLLTGNFNGVVKIWNAENGELIREIATGERGLACARFSPDGTKFLSTAGHIDPRLQVYETATGLPTGGKFTHYENVSDAEFSPDSKLIVAADLGREAFIREVATGRNIGAPIWARGQMTQAHFHPSGKLVLINEPGGVRVVRLCAGSEVADAPRVDPQAAEVAKFVEQYKRIIPGVEYQGRPINHTFLVLSPDRKLLAKCSYGEDVQMIDANTNKLLYAIPKTANTWGLYWKPDSSEFVTAEWLATKVRAAATGHAKAEINFIEPTSGSFGPDGQLFAISIRNYNLALFETNTYQPTGPAFEHPCRVRFSTFTPDGKRIITSDASGTSRIWHIATGKRIGPPLAGDAPRISLDQKTFTTYDGGQSRGYYLPQLITGTVDEVFAKIDAATDAPTTLDHLRDYTTPSDPTLRTIGIEQAFSAIGETVILEMEIRSVGRNKAGEWLYLNSMQSFKDTNNTTVAVKFPTVERLQAMGLPAKDEEIVGLRVRAAGKINLYFDRPELIVEVPRQLQVLPAGK